MSEELKPCPFCGGEAEMEEIKGGIYSSWSVGCRSMEGPDECIGQQSLLSFARKCEAIAAWNRRASPTPTPEGREWPFPNFTLDQIDAAVMDNDSISLALAAAVTEATKLARALLSSPRVERELDDVPAKTLERVIERVLTDVCELPDRSSPDDQPEMMLVTGEELDMILKRHLGLEDRAALATERKE